MISLGEWYKTLLHRAWHFTNGSKDFLQNKGLNELCGATSSDGWRFICLIKWLWPQFHPWTPIYHQILAFSPTCSVNSLSKRSSMISSYSIYAHAFQSVRDKFIALYSPPCQYKLTQNLMSKPNMKGQILCFWKGRKPKNLKSEHKYCVNPFNFVSRKIMIKINK